MADGWTGLDVNDKAVLLLIKYGDSAFVPEYTGEVIFQRLKPVLFNFSAEGHIVG